VSAEIKTPRTDKFVFGTSNGFYEVCDFARELECELAVAEAALNQIIRQRGHDCIGTVNFALAKLAEMRGGKKVNHPRHTLLHELSAMESRAGSTFALALRTLGMAACNVPNWRDAETQFLQRVYDNLRAVLKEPAHT